MTLLAQFAATGGGAANYIEDVFSTWLYTGNFSTQTITNGIDLAGKGGLVWIKSRSAATDHFLFDTVRGALNEVNSNSTAAQVSLAASLTAFNANGFSLGLAAGVNTGSATYTSWSFRDQAKFFDVVTYTGTGANRTIAHNLGAVPGCIMVKRIDNTGDWQVYHRSLANTQYMVLNSTAAVATGATRWNSTTPTDTAFSLGTDATVNASGGTYVAYIFAHNAGGFGLSGADNVISCGSFTTDGSGNATVVLGYESQWVLAKRSSGTGGWLMFDTMRGMTVAGQDDALLYADSANSELTGSSFCSPEATGFSLTDFASSTYVYVAIRRGPMKVPTTGTSVLGLNARTGAGANRTIAGSAGVSDAALIKNRGSAVGDLFASRLTGTGYLETSSIAAEVAAGVTILQANPWDVMDGVKVGTTSTITNASANTYINYLFDRAPGFMDVVCYTGTGANRTVTHNLAAVPELMIVKSRGASALDWTVYAAPLGATSGLYLNSAQAVVGPSSTLWNSTTPTSSVFSLGANTLVNQSSQTYIAYLFATCPGVSKVGSYTGTATTQVVNCGFTGGARFVLIKRTDLTGDWYVWDSARGIVAGNDPYLLINSTAAEVTSTDYIDTAATGFEITSTAPAAINASGGSYIFLAIA
jgi:hypothetical protein